MSLMVGGLLVGVCVHSYVPFMLRTRAHTRASESIFISVDRLFLFLGVLGGVRFDHVVHILCTSVVILDIISA